MFEFLRQLTLNFMSTPVFPSLVSSNGGDAAGDLKYRSIKGNKTLVWLCFFLDSYEDCSDSLSAEKKLEALRGSYLLLRI
ncbi:hypothetical protein SUGI_0318620 [Cryptomeria japonica]|nr:hypothetical protein SUGI_0318620 [Cryptomeria japonica]